MAYPSPPFLLEPAHEGPLTAEELPVYMAYIRYQLRRGTAVGENGRKIAGDHNRNRIRYTPAQMAVMTALVRGPADRRTLAAQTGLEIKTVRSVLDRFSERGLVRIADRHNRPHWAITESGRVAFGQIGCTTDAKPWSEQHAQ